MRKLVVIPARGGSKGIPLKNIYPINGKPLIEYTLDILSELNIEGDVVVSTDSAAISEIVKKYPSVMVIRRPDEISQDLSRTEDALLHALDYMWENYTRDYDYVVTMQATSPLRKIQTVQAFLNEFEKNINKYDAQLTLTETRADYWLRDITGGYERLFPNAPRRRQDRDPLYIENSMLYATTVSSLKATYSVLGTNVNGFVISEEEAVDINNREDIFLTEMYLEFRRGTL